MNNISMALDDIIDVSTKATADLDAIRKGPVEREINSVNSNRDWYKDTMSTLIPVAITPEIKKQIVVSAQGMGDLGIKLVGVTKVAGVKQLALRSSRQRSEEHYRCHSSNARRRRHG
jgi:rare lipoprotein A (peptidoglycan hydrolase)